LEYTAQRQPPRLAATNKKNPAGCPAGFKSILVGRLEETNQTISTQFRRVRFRIVMPDINFMNE
jgi:hypothetical protein